MKTNTVTIAKTIKLYEPGDVVYDVVLRQFFFLANRTPEYDHLVKPGNETFSAFRLVGRRFCEPRVISQDPEKENDEDTIRYVGTLYDYWEGLDSGRLTVRM